MTTFHYVLLDSGLGSGLFNIIRQSNREYYHAPGYTKTVCSNVVSCNLTNKNLILTICNTVKPYYIQPTSLMHVPDFLNFNTLISSNIVIKIHSAIFISCILWVNEYFCDLRTPPIKVLKKLGSCPKSSDHFQPFVKNYPNFASFPLINCRHVNKKTKIWAK